MPRKTNTKIMKRHLILCEGRDEQEFLIAWLNSAALHSVPAFSEEIQVIDFGGNQDLPAYLRLLQNAENFDKVRSILVIRDAEKDAKRAVCEIQESFHKNDLPVPETPQVWENGVPKTGFLLFPKFDREPECGTLEDLCLSLLSDPNASCLTKEIDAFMSALEERCRLVFRRPFKTRLHTYFSIHNKYVSLKIGEAANAGAFDLDNKSLEPLKNFLLEVL